MRNNVLKCGWLVKDLETNKDWLFKLDEKDQDEIAEATKFSLKSGKNLFEITDKDFPIQDLLIKIKHIQHQLDSGLGFILLQNLPVEKFNDEEVKFMLWAVIFSIPRSLIKSTAVPIAIAPTIFGVPASNLCGMSANVEFCIPT